MDKKLIARFAVRETVAVLFMGMALFWSAGRIDWWPAWALIAVTCGWIVGTAIVILQYHPDLLAERLGPRKGAKRWDLAIMSVHGLLQLASYVVAGLDKRYGWTAGVPATLQVAAFALCALGYALVVWATASNRFFSQIVRIQSERGHTITTAGPYHYVRHPAYAGGTLTQIFAPVLLASWPAFIIGLVDTCLMILRTSLEDHMLQVELQGYADYTRQVRYRLIPGVW